MACNLSPYRTGLSARSLACLVFRCQCFMLDQLSASAGKLCHKPLPNSQAAVVLLWSDKIRRAVTRSQIPDKCLYCHEWRMWPADLLALWQAHGTGLVAKHALLHFQDGALTAPSPASGALSPRDSQPHRRSRMRWPSYPPLGSSCAVARGCTVSHLHRTRLEQSPLCGNLQAYLLVTDHEVQSLCSWMYA